jgi:hypothetical protein
MALPTHILLKLRYNFDIWQRDGWAVGALSALRRVAVLLGPFFDSTRAASILPDRQPPHAGAVKAGRQAFV